MDSNDQQAIAALFDRLSQVARQMPDRDAEAERFIAACIARQPGAPYYMAQTVVVQEHALTTAQARIAELQAELAEARRASQDGGFLAGLFGADPPPRRPRPVTPPLPQGAPGGFLAGAGQTAMGVAGGMLLASAVAGLFAADPAAADAPAAAEPDPEPDTGDGGFDIDSDW